jgi:orotate phosphoribosyltransferase
MKMDIARGLIEKGCVKFSPQNPFTYASGLKGPIYCDNRLILSHVDFREKIVTAFLEVIKQYSKPTDLLGGIATAGIPYAGFIFAQKLKNMGKKTKLKGITNPISLCF